jgi:hypothetical protein
MKRGFDIIPAQPELILPIFFSIFFLFLRALRDFAVR